MKKIITKIYTASFLFITTLASAFPEDIGTGPTGTSDPQAPIDNYLLFLIILGIGFAYWVKTTKKVKTT